MKKVLVLLVAAALATAVQAEAEDISSLFTNLDFNEGASGGPFNGFANIDGWTDYPSSPLIDAGVEGPGAWWLPAEYPYGQAAFMSSGDAAYNMSSYVIRSGDVFTISFLAGVWGWEGAGDGRGEWTATLFYDDPANVIGSFVQEFFDLGLMDQVRFTDPDGITATPESAGGTLGILFENTTGDKIAQVDEITVSVIGTIGPYDPVVFPENPEGSVGVLISSEEAEVTLSWKAGADPDEERGHPIDPDILGHYIFISSGDPADDPNVHPLDYVEQVHAVDPYDTDPNNTYGPIVLSQGTVYYWQIVHEMLNPDTGVGYPMEDPNNIAGPVWSFTTIGVMPQILEDPQSMYVDADGNASFSVTASTIATDYRWFKVGDQEDIELTDNGTYSGTQTNTLTITGVTLAEEGQYYCIAYNGDPEEGGTPSAPSASAWLWIPRLLIHYPLDTIEIVDGNEVTPDVASGFDMTLMHNAGGALPSLVGGVPELGGNGLLFNNSDREDPNNTWGQYATAGAVNMEELGNALTISFWVQWVGNNDDWQGIINRRGSWNSADMMWRIDKNPTSGEISFEREGGAGRVATDLVEGDWHYITAVFDSTTSTTRMYNNGELVSTGSGFTYGTGVNSGFKLGCNNDNGSEFFYGILDDVKIYNYARTTEQIAQDFLAVKGGWVCNYEEYDLPFDFTGDCMVGLADFALFAETWLDSFRIYPEN